MRFVVLLLVLFACSAYPVTVKKVSLYSSYAVTPSDSALLARMLPVWSVMTPAQKDTLYKKNPLLRKIYHKGEIINGFFGGWTPCK